MKIAAIKVGENPQLLDIEPDSERSYLKAFQGLVGGLVEAFDPLWGDEPCLLVNEEYLFNGSEPNRAIYANKRMYELEYLSPFTRDPVMPGELYNVIYGDFIAVSYTPEGEPRDITEEEFEEVYSTFAGSVSVLSGMVEAQSIKRAQCTEHIKVNLPDTQESYFSGNGEGVWVLVAPEVKQLHDEDARGGLSFGVLDNDSVYYPSLKHGEVIPFEWRGEKRPVAPFSYLVQRFGA